MTTGSIFWVVVSAAIGGVLVFVGLLMERFSEKDWYKTADDLRRCKSRKVCGEWFVIGGIVVEIGVGIVSAVTAWENDPLNRPVSDMSALVYFEVKGGGFKEMDPKALTHGDIGWIAFLNVCETNDVPSNLMPGTLFSDSFFKGYMGNSTDSDRVYAMRFNPEIMGWHVPNGRRAKEINKIKKVVIEACFLPQNVEILRGEVTLVVNSELQKVFLIPPQKNQPTSNAFLNSRIIFATNASPATLKQYEIDSLKVHVFSGK